ncbi:hypothetical protein [Dialister succinatiphilus]|uniref:hypothetical protein n=1 Tax=Dialister succinatiphilus TaxID=487173 RepID=UPI003F7FF199
MSVVTVHRKSLKYDIKTLNYYNNIVQENEKTGNLIISSLLARCPLMDKPLWGLKVLKFNGAIAPRVLKFDSGSAAEGCGGRLTFIEGALL